jgi:hypothetical protein
LVSGPVRFEQMVRRDQLGRLQSGDRIFVGLNKENNDTTHIPASPCECPLALVYHSAIPDVPDRPDACVRPRAGHGVKRTRSTTEDTLALRQSSMPTFDSS